MDKSRYDMCTREGKKKRVSSSIIGYSGPCRKLTGSFPPSVSHVSLNRTRSCPGWYLSQAFSLSPNYPLCTCTYRGGGGRWRFAPAPLLLPRSLTATAAATPSDLDVEFLTFGTGESAAPRQGAPVVGVIHHGLENAPPGIDKPGRGKI